MIVHSLKYMLPAVTAISLLSSCAGSSTPTTPPGFQQNQSHAGKRATSPCPCLYVADFYAGVHVYAEGASGDATPIQDISGSNTGLGLPTDVAVDASGNIYVANDGANSVTVYAAGSTGDVAPVQDISGSMTGLWDPQGIALNPLNGDIYVAPERKGGEGRKITIYPSGSTGNIAPTGIIKGLRTAIDFPLKLTLGPTGKLYVPNVDGNSVTVYRAGVTHGVPPIQDISGSNTGLDAPEQIALDTHGRIYVVNYSNDSVTVYATRANGNIAPIRTIAGSNTNLNDPAGIALDGSGHIYVANAPESGTGYVTVYAAHANGNIAPINTISGPNTGLRAPEGITIR